MSGLTTSTSDAALLAPLDSDVACGYQLHGSVGSGPAVWAVWYRQPHPCGCQSPGFLYFCAPCWRYRNHMGSTRCAGGHRLGAMDDIARVERITGATP